MFEWILGQQKLLGRPPMMAKDDQKFLLERTDLFPEGEVLFYVYITFTSDLYFVIGKHSTLKYTEYNQCFAATSTSMSYQPCQ